MKALNLSLIELCRSVKPDHEKVPNDSQIQVHVATFTFNELQRLKLVYESYSKNPASGWLGDISPHKEPLIAALLDRLSQKPCCWGQKNVWIWGHCTIVFTEIIELGSPSIAIHYATFKKLVDDYNQEIFNEDTDATGLFQDDLSRESSDYASFIFWRHWTGRDFQNMPDPRDGANSMLRSQLAWAYGSQACDDLARLIREAKTKKGKEINSALGLDASASAIQLPGGRLVSGMETFIYESLKCSNPPLAYSYELSGSESVAFTNGRLCVNFLNEDYLKWMRARTQTQQEFDRREANEALEEMFGRVFQYA